MQAGCFDADRLLQSAASLTAMKGNLEGAAMPAKITTPAFPKLTPQELEELIQQERAKGNPWAIFADDPEDKVFWEGVNRCRREMDQQQAEMDALSNGCEQES